MSNHISVIQVQQIAQLAQLPVSEAQAKNLQSAFEETLGVIDNLKELDISQTPPTHQVTGLEDVMREDAVDAAHSFTQEQALQNAKAQHDGYFVVSRILDND